ncbi:Replicative DNA helicase [Aliarcobacter thereius]|uniref:Replicative DNA helicase n=1 Tax=Aliarcobacter thereius TaxID=544718 RepID=A0A1C0B7N5_9BACT|nr:AAA family ATPase [Aliarcobacter thereius]OCL99542.1 Replicative DNA helicase [Aliarcobacter thereius]
MQNNNLIIQTEISVLSSILFDQSNMKQIAIKLKPSDFYLSVHRDIYEAMLELYRDEMPIDEDYIIKKSKNPINQNALMQIISATPISDIYTYVKSIKEDSLRRQFQSLSSELKRNSENENLSNDEIFEFLKDRQDEIRFNNILSINKKSILDISEKEPEFYLKDWLPIPLGTITIISAPGGTGKTWIVAQLALRFILEHPNKKIFLWLSEDLESIVKHRMNLICNSILNISLNERFKNITITNTFPEPLLERSKGVFKMSYKFDQLKAELKDYDLIVLDPLLAFYGADENDNSQARLFMQPFMNWAKEENKSIIFLHHSNKQNGTDASIRTRGAGAFVDAARVCYEVNKIYKKDNKTLDIDSLHLRDVKLAKDNYGAIKHLKHFNVNRHITPRDSSKDFIEIVFENSSDKYELPDIMM